MLTRISMPEATIFSSRIIVEGLTNALGCLAILLLLCLLIENQEEISGQHVIERRYLPVDYAVVTDVMVDPSLDVAQISFVARPLIEKVLPVEIERNGITPVREILCIRIAMHRGVDDGLRPIGRGDIP